MSTSVSTETLGRIARLIPLLASDKIGEVAATAAAIERVLKVGGADFQDLAETLAAGPLPKPIRSPAPLIVPTMNLLTRDRTIAWMQSIASQPWTTDWEAEFCLSIADQVYRQPHRTFTIKQTKAANGLLRRAFAEGVRP